MIIRVYGKSSGFTILEVVLTVILSIAAMFLSSEALISFQRGQMTTQKYIERDLDYMVAQRYFFKKASEAAYFKVPDANTLEMYGYAGDKLATYKNASTDPDVTTNSQFKKVTVNSFTGVKLKTGKNDGRYATVRVVLAAAGEGASVFTSTVIIKANIDVPPTETWAYDVAIGPYNEVAACDQVRNSGSGDDGYIFAGYASSLPFDVNRKYLYLLKMSTLGTLRWFKKYYFSDTAIAYRPTMIKTIYSSRSAAYPVGYAILGKVQTAPPALAGSGISIMVTDLSGNVMAHGGVPDFYFYPAADLAGADPVNITQVFDHGNLADGFVITGSTASKWNGTYFATKGVIIRTDTSGNPVWQKIVQPTNPLGWSHVRAADFNGDNKADIAGRNQKGEWLVAISNGSSFTSTKWGTWDPSAASTTGCTNLLTPDLNGDGKADLFGATDYFNESWYTVSLSTGSEFTSPQTGDWDPNSRTSLRAADVTGDGSSDIVGRKDNGRWSVAQWDGARSRFTYQYWGDMGSYVFTDIAVADINGDNRADIVARKLYTGDWLAARSTGSSFIFETWCNWSPVTWVDVQPCDVNGDGKDDIVGRYAVDGSWWVARSTGAGFLNECWTAWSPITWLDVHSADFNGDGKDDIAGRTSSGQWWVARSTGAGFINEYWGYWSPIVWLDVRVADFSGDGMADIAGRTLSGDWWIARSTGTGFVNEFWGHWDLTSVVEINSPSDVLQRFDSSGNSTGYVVSNMATSYANGGRILPVLLTMGEDGSLTSCRFYDCGSLPFSKCGLSAGLNTSNQPDGSCIMAVSDTSLVSGGYRSCLGIIKTSADLTSVAWAKKFDYWPVNAARFSGHNRRTADGGYLYDSFASPAVVKIDASVGPALSSNGNPSFLQPDSIGYNVDYVFMTEALANSGNCNAYFGGCHVNDRACGLVYRSNTNGKCPELTAPDQITLQPTQVLLATPTAPGGGTSSPAAYNSEVVYYTPDSGNP